MNTLIYLASELMAAIPSPSRGTIYIGSFPLRGYAITMMLGMVAACIIGTIRYTTRTRVRGLPGDRDGVVEDGIGEAVPPTILVESSTASGVGNDDDAAATERVPPVAESVVPDREGLTAPSQRWKFWNRPGAEDMLDVTFWAIPFGIVGARLYHIITHWQAYFGPYANWTNVFRIWEGGLAIIGAIAGGAIGAWIACRRRGILLPVVADALAPGLLVAQAIGRWGNWFNQELFGRPTTLPWGLEISPSHLPIDPITGLRYAEGTLFHPTFLYESLWNLAMAGLLVWIDRRFRLGHGRVLMLYVYLYCLGRTWVEMLRIDTANVILGLRVNSWAVMLLGTAAMIGFCVIGYLKPGREPDARRDPALAV